MKGHFKAVEGLLHGFLVYPVGKYLFAGLICSEGDIDSYHKSQMGSGSPLPRSFKHARHEMRA